MKHVFAETNFIIELVRPLPGPDAQALYERDDVEIHVPWVSVAESKRTLKHKIIREDLSFASLLRKLVAREFREQRLSRDEKKIVESLVARVEDEYGEALGAVESDVDAVAKRLEIIPPSEHVVNTVMKLYNIKSLPPFDEMIMGAGRRTARLRGAGFLLLQPEQAGLLPKGKFGARSRVRAPHDHLPDLIQGPRDAA